MAKKLNPKLRDCSECGRPHTGFTEKCGDCIREQRNFIVLGQRWAKTIPRVTASNAVEEKPRATNKKPHTTNVPRRLRGR